MRKKMMIGFCMLAALLCFTYCFIVFRIRSGSRFYLIWGLGGLFFIAVAMVVQFDWWGGFPKWLRQVIVGLFIGGMISFVGIESLIFQHYRDRGRADLDYIIVLGAQMKPAGPSAVLKFRLDAAYDYLIENEDTLCVVSGGQGANEPCTEAQGMRDYLVGRGIAPERILMEDKSTDTSENIAYSAELIGGTDYAVGIVTNNFHVFRGVMLARHAGFEGACGIAARSNIYFQPNNLVREFFGILKDLVCGNLL
ncbi:MAG: YdcF family protein [Bacteroidales bacterium]|nr:YdcF family protein [Bacteroidales bacterium]MCM1414679.1 YdcF family protein [bacterium]MCM1424959.1 YdcF family protein [bacterium]